MYIPLRNKDMLGGHKPALDQPLSNSRPQIPATDDRYLLIHKNVPEIPTLKNTVFPANI
jgi:hypothetical protein